MNALLDPLRQIARDLVEKKLWPVAIALLAALVAVPIVIGASAGDPPPSSPQPLAASAPAATKSLVTVVDKAVTGKETRRPGRVSDPFYDPPAPVKDAPATATTAPPAAAPAGETPGATTPPAQSADPVTAPAYYRTVVRWYENDRAKPVPIARLTPLGGLLDTAALYLGVTRSTGLYAIFLLGPKAVSEGEGTCEDASDCRVVGLKAGQTQIVTILAEDGTPERQYSLEVVAVKHVTTDRATARRMRLAVHPDGRDVMRELWSDGPTAQALGPIQYDSAAGLLVKGAAAGSAGSTAAAKAASSGDEAAG